MFRERTNEVVSLRHTNRIIIVVLNHVYEYTRIVILNVKPSSRDHFGQVFRCRLIPANQFQLEEIRLVQIVKHRLVAEARSHSAETPGDTASGFNSVHLHLDKRLFSTRDRIEEFTASFVAERFVRERWRARHQKSFAAD